MTPNDEKLELDEIGISYTVYFQKSKKRKRNESAKNSSTVYCYMVNRLLQYAGKAI